MTRRRFRQRRSTTSLAPAQPSAPSHQLRAPSLAVRPRDRVRRPPRTHRRFVVRSVDVASDRDGVLVGPDGFADVPSRDEASPRRSSRAPLFPSRLLRGIRAGGPPPPRWSSATTRLTSARPPTPSSAPWASAWSPAPSRRPRRSPPRRSPDPARRRTLARMLAPRRLRRGRRRVWHGPQRRSRRLPRIRVRSLRGGRDARAVPRPGCRPGRRRRAAKSSAVAGVPTVACLVPTTSAAAPIAPACAALEAVLTRMRERAILPLDAPTNCPRVRTFRFPRDVGGRRLAPRSSPRTTNSPPRSRRARISPPRTVGRWVDTARCRAGGVRTRARRTPGRRARPRRAARRRNSAPRSETPSATPTRS